MSVVSVGIRHTALAPVAWSRLLVLASIELALLLATSGFTGWGFMTDELYYLDSTSRLAWGFVDHPPLSIAVLAAGRAVLGDSLLAVRAVPTLAGCATLILAGLLARQLGGGRAAQSLAALAVLASPVHLGVFSFYSMNAIDLALWALVFVLLARLVNGGSPRLWLLMGVVMGAGLLNKASMLWFGAGLAAGLVLTSERRWLRTPWPWRAGAFALLCFTPFLIWQAQHDWPFLEFSRNAARDKIGYVSPIAFLAQQVLALNPVAAPLWIGGLIALFANPRLRPYRHLGWIFLVTFAILAASGSARPHYLAPAAVIVFAAGACAVEWLAPRWPWLPATIAVALALGGAAAAPLALPFLPPTAVVAYERALHFHQPQELEPSGVLPIHFALRLHAEAVLEPVAAVYAELSPADRERVRILTFSFGETGAINVLGRERGLPKSIGTSNQYWLWGPGDATGDLMIVVHQSGAQLEQWFEHCEREREIECPLCMPALDAKAVYLCRKARRPLRELWPEMKLYR